MRKPAGYWSKEKCQEVALTCKTKIEFEKNYVTAYKKCLKHNWLDDFCSHMVQNRKPSGYWTKERCQEIALLCSSRLELSDNYKTVYTLATTNNWLDDICSHMVSKQNYITKEKCQEVALLCKTRSEYKLKYFSLYSKAKKCKWLDDICSHMKDIKKHGYWTKERCHELAKLCNFRVEFSDKYPTAYNKAKHNKW